MSRRRAPDTEVDSTPRLLLRDQDREDVADAIAEMLVQAVQAEKNQSA